MNKSDLTRALSKELDLPARKAEEIVDLVFETMHRTLVSGDRIEIRGFGSFEVKDYGGYTGRNPKTGEQIPVEDKKLPSFKVGKELRDPVNSWPGPEGSEITTPEKAGKRSLRVA